MSIDFVNPPLTELVPRITVIGVGGAGGNAVNNMVDTGLNGVDFVVANTDAQALASSRTENRIQLGLKITQGLGAGSRPEIGRAAAEETLEQLEEALDGSHMCFITAGMGGGTGTGATPVIARAARERGILTVGVVTKPFTFEGKHRMRSAEEGILELQKHVDTLIIIPNQNLFRLAGPQTTFKQAFGMADEVLHAGVRGITDLMMMPGLINLDFADIRTVMSEMGKAMMGTGEAEGEGRALKAAQAAIANPLLDEICMQGAKGVIINITGGEDLTLFELDEAANHIRELVDEDANIIVGSALNPELEGRVRVSVVATGIDVLEGKSAAPLSAPIRQPTAFGGASNGSFSDTPLHGSAGFAGSSFGKATSAKADAPAVSKSAPVTRQEPASEVVELPASQAAEDVLALDARDVVSSDDADLLAGAPMPKSEPIIDSEDRQVRMPTGPRLMRKPEPQPAKSPSLFERMMGIGSGSEAPAAAEPQRATGTDGVAAPRSSAASDDPLEIPSIFRRQAN